MPWNTHKAKAKEGISGFIFYLNFKQMEVGLFLNIFYDEKEMENLNIEGFINAKNVPKM